MSFSDQTKRRVGILAWMLAAVALLVTGGVWTIAGRTQPAVAGEVTESPLFTTALVERRESVKVAAVAAADTTSTNPGICAPTTHPEGSICPATTHPSPNVCAVTSHPDR